jgi:hypothetical protein
MTDIEKFCAHLRVLASTDGVLFAPSFAQAADVIERMASFLEGDARCPCCDTLRECADDCTFSEDCPAEYERMTIARAALYGQASEDAAGKPL